MGGSVVRRWTLFLNSCFLCGIIREVPSLKLEDQSTESTNKNGSVSLEPDQTYFRFRNCTLNENCSSNYIHSGSTVPAICDISLGRCTCPTTIQTLIPYKDHCLISLELGSSCKDDLQCSLSVLHSICYRAQNQSQEGTCECLHKNKELCTPSVHEAPSRSSLELFTLKWVFIFILVGYPVITFIFAMKEKESIDENRTIRKCLHFFTKSRNEMNRNRRNTEDEIVSNDDEDTPLEMEFV